MKFLDRVKIFIQSGKGGDGLASFSHKRFIPKGGPDGGHGGKGGNIYAVADPNLNTLIDYRYTQHFRSEKGQNGGKNNKTGRNGTDILLKFPIETTLLDETETNVLWVINKPNQKIILLSGGRGGAGNKSFATSVNRAPRYAHPGQLGENRWVWVVYKMRADIAILGAPNTGKTQLFNILANQNQKVDHYPFTTLHPHMGEIIINSQVFSVLDLPGIIKGSAEGKGRGLHFLRHTEHAKLIIILAREGTQDNAIIQSEIQRIAPERLVKPHVITVDPTYAISHPETLMQTIHTALKKTA